MFGKSKKESFQWYFCNIFSGPSILSLASANCPYFHLFSSFNILMYLQSCFRCEPVVLTVSSTAGKQPDKQIPMPFSSPHAAHLLGHSAGVNKWICEWMNWFMHEWIDLCMNELIYEWIIDLWITQHRLPLCLTFWMIKWRDEWLNEFLIDYMYEWME